MFSGYPEASLYFVVRMWRDKFIWENNRYDGWYAIIVREGRFEVDMLGKHDEVGAGDVVLFPPDVLFSRRITEPIRFIYIYFKWQNASGDYDWKDSPDLPFGKLDFPVKSRRDEDIEALAGLCNDPDPGARRLAEHYFNDIWYECRRTGRPAGVIDADKISDPIIARSMVYISGNSAKPIHVSELAAMSGMSHVNFTNRFRAAVGVPPIDYIKRVRLGKACAMLSEGSLSVAEIAYACGFENQFYFSRCFSKAFGLPPSEWKSKNRI